MTALLVLLTFLSQQALSQCTQPDAWTPIPNDTRVTIMQKFDESAALVETMIFFRGIKQNSNEIVLHSNLKSTDPACDYQSYTITYAYLPYWSTVIPPFISGQPPTIDLTTVIPTFYGIIGTVDSSTQFYGTFSDFNGLSLQYPFEFCQWQGQDEVFSDSGMSKWQINTKGVTPYESRTLKNVFSQASSTTDNSLCGTPSFRYSDVAYPLNYAIPLASQPYSYFPPNYWSGLTISVDTDYFVSVPFLDLKVEAIVTFHHIGIDYPIVIAEQTVRLQPICDTMTYSDPDPESIPSPFPAILQLGVDVYQTIKFPSMSFADPPSCGSLPTEYTLECTDTFGSTLIVSNDNVITEPGRASRCSKFIWDMPNRMITFDSSVNFADEDAGNYTISVFGGTGPLTGKAFDFQIILVSSLCASTASISVDSTPLKFQNVDPLGSIVTDSPEILYHFKMPEQVYPVPDGVFTNSNPDCPIQYSLTTDTAFVDLTTPGTIDIPTTYPGISLQIDPSKPDQVLIVILYPENEGLPTINARLTATYVGFTQRSPLLQKHYSVDFDIYFHLNCFGTASSLKETKDLGEISYITGNIATDLFYPRAVWDLESDNTHCPFVNANHTLINYYYKLGQPYNDQIFTLTPDQPNINDGEHNQLSIYTNLDSYVQVYNKNNVLLCDLQIVPEKSCVITFAVQIGSFNGTFADLAYGILTVSSECFTLPFVPLSEQASYWNTKSDQQTIINAGYGLRSDQVSFESALVSPVLQSGLGVLSVCGSFYYTTTSNRPELVTTQEADPDNAFGATITIRTDNDNLVPTISPYESIFKVTSEANFQFYEGLITYKYDTDFMIYDYCLGMTFSNAEIDLGKSTATVTGEQRLAQTPTDPILLQKYALSANTGFTMDKLTYTQFKKNPSDPDVKVGCGELVYTPSTSLDDSTWFVMDFERNAGKALFQLKVQEERYVGTHHFTVVVESETVKRAPKHLIKFQIDILPCFVEAFYIGSQFWSEQVMKFDEFVVETIPKFSWEPKCNLELVYTVSVIEAQLLQPVSALGPSQIGKQTSPAFVSLTGERLQVNPSSNDPTLGDKSYSVFVTGTLKTNLSVQEPMQLTTKPLLIHLFNDLVTPNQPPSIQNFSGDQVIKAGQKTLIDIGRPFDQEGSELYVKSWDVLNQPNYTWITFLNDTNQNINFAFDPPADVTVVSFDLLILIAESNSIEQLESQIVINVGIQKDAEPVFDFEAPEELQVEEESKPLEINIETPTVSGELTVSFSEFVAVPISMLTWTSENEGKDAINIEYVQSQATLNTYDQVNLYLQWSLEVLEQRQAQQVENEEAFYVQIKSFKISIDIGVNDQVSNFKEDEDSVILSFDALKFSGFAGGTSHKLLSDAIQLTNESGSNIKNIPQQVNKVEAERIEAAAKGTRDVLAAFLSANIFLSLGFAFLIQYLWGLINTIQIIMLTGLFSTIMPVNAQLTIFAVLKLTNLDFFSIDKLWAHFYPSDSEEFPTLNQRFEAAGYESSNFVVELGPALFVFIGIQFAYGLKALFQLCIKACQSINKTGEKKKKKSWLAKTCVKSRVGQFFLGETHYKSTMMRFFLESCLEVGLVSMVTIQNLNPDTEQIIFRIGQYGSILFLVGLVFSPIYLFFALKFFLKAVKEGDSVVGNRYLNMFNYYSFQSRFSIGFGIVFFIRRYIMILILTLFPEKMFVQIGTHLLTTSAVISYLFQFHPYYYHRLNLQDIINEVTVLLAGYHLLCFTQWLKFDQRFLMGWSLQITIALNVFINMVMIIIELVYTCKETARQKYLVNKRIDGLTKMHERVKEAQLAKQEAQNALRLQQAQVPRRDAINIDFTEKPAEYQAPKVTEDKGPKDDKGEPDVTLIENQEVLNFKDDFYHDQNANIPIKIKSHPHTPSLRDYKVQEEEFFQQNKFYMDKLLYNGQNPVFSYQQQDKTQDSVMINTRIPSMSVSYMNADDDDVPLHHLVPNSYLKEDEIKVDKDFDVFTYGKKTKQPVIKDAREPEQQPIADYDDSFNYRSNSRLLNDDDEQPTTNNLSFLDRQDEQLVQAYLDDRQEQHNISARGDEQVVDSKVLSSRFEPDQQILDWVDEVDRGQQYHQNTNTVIPAGRERDSLESNIWKEELANEGRVDDDESQRESIDSEIWREELRKELARNPLF